MRGDFDAATGTYPDGSITPNWQIELRDWFAGMAMQSILHEDMVCDPESVDPEEIQRIGKQAEQSYVYADAMMKARGK